MPTNHTTNTVEQFKKKIEEQKYDEIEKLWKTDEIKNIFKSEDITYALDISTVIFQKFPKERTRHFIKCQNNNKLLNQLY
ncbi:MAG: hypothetical protein CMF49_09870 [Legionellales bacterium]|nr:hypothetical protein [Legionellales bacterium]|tara:strand:- start:341 stop:580 length:240 start_codon:yes stop_codon:yes gene_type:complete